MRDLRYELQTDTGALPAAWAPEVGDMLVGRIVSIADSVTQFGPCLTVIVEEDGTETQKTLRIGPACLRTLWQKHQPGEGDKIGVKRIASPQGKTWKNFTMIVERAEESGAYPYCTATGIDSDDPFVN